MSLFSSARTILSFDDKLYYIKEYSSTDNLLRILFVCNQERMVVISILHI